MPSIRKILLAAFLLLGTAFAAPMTSAEQAASDRAIKNGLAIAEAEEAAAHKAAAQKAAQDAAPEIKDTIALESCGLAVPTPHPTLQNIACAVLQLHDHGVKMAKEEADRLQAVDWKDPKAFILRKYPGGPRGNNDTCWWIPGQPGKSVDGTGRIRLSLDKELDLTDYCGGELVHWFFQDMCTEWFWGADPAYISQCSQWIYSNSPKS